MVDTLLSGRSWNGMRVTRSQHRESGNWEMSTLRMILKWSNDLPSTDDGVRNRDDQNQQISL